VRASNRLRSRFGEAKVLDFAGLDQVFDRPGDLFDRHVRVDPVLIVQVNRLDSKPLE